MKARRFSLSLVTIVITALVLQVDPTRADPLQDGASKGVWQGARPVEVQILDQGIYGPWIKPALVLIGSSDEWDKAMITAGAVIPVPAPDIDWSRYALILAVLGQQPFVGYSISVIEAFRHAHDLLLRFHVELPDSPNPTQNFSSPYLILMVERWKSMGVKAEYDAIVPELGSEIPRPKHQARLEGGNSDPVSWSELKARYR
jgi:hypothetical protein